MPEDVHDAEFIDDDVNFRFDIDHQGMNFELGAWSFNFVVKVVWDALARGLNLLANVWNGILAMLSGQPIPNFNF